jgi:purine catabolism regulator
MPARLTDLVGDSRLGLSVLVGGDSLQRPIGWVAVSEHEDPTPFLQDGELLLTTGLRLPPSDAAVDEYVDRLVAAGVVGLGLGVGLVHQRTPSRLVDSARRAGLVLLEVAEETPFVAISKRVSDLQVAERHAEVTWANKAQQELTRTAVTDGAPAVVRKLSRLLGSWVAELDAWGEPVHVHPRSARTGLARMAVEVELVRRKGFASASIVEDGKHLSVHRLGTGKSEHGMLLVGSGQVLSSAQRSLVSVATALLSFERARGLAAEGAERCATVLDLVRAGAVTDAEQLRLLGCPLLGRQVLWAVCAGGATQDRQAWLDGLQALGPDRLVFSADRQLHHVVLGSERDVSLACGLAQASTAVRLGVAGPTDDGAGDLEGTFVEAARALQRANRQGVAVVTYSDVVHDATSLSPPADAEAFAIRVLAPLRDYSARSGNDLEPTLTVWLRHHGHFEAAAVELRVHRHTLRNRVARAQQLLGRDLDDVDVRMDLWFALRIVQSGRVDPVDVA